MEGKDRFLALRKRVFALIKRELEEDSYCKSYEGAIELMCEYPDYFEDERAEAAPNYYRVTLHCYVLGSIRHHEFDGETISEALDMFEKQISEWENIV